jgi:electron transfer flavoprotein alpha subunit
MVLVFAETQEGSIKKSALEVVHLGAKLAESAGSECAALVLGDATDAGKLGQYGAKTVFQVKDEQLNSFDAQVYSKVIARIAKDQHANVVIVADSAEGRSVLGMLSIILQAGAVRGVNKLPEVKDGKLMVGRNVFSGKAKAACRINSDISVISIAGNSVKPKIIGQDIAVTDIKVDVPKSKTKVIEVKRSVGIVPLPEAEIVVSAGRGMKDPGNWGVAEELAGVLGATLACSRPVADSGWRPHHEHVGQTGIAIRPNLYIAMGISGAIQHLAGVNGSKVIVVINKDAEAPFFKAADYGVVGDLFDVVPRLTEAIKKFKATSH